MIASDPNDVYFQAVNDVSESWDAVKKIPNYIDIAGELLFRK
jgi:hypothetical protein